MRKLLLKLFLDRLQRHLSHGAIEVLLPDGEGHIVGDGAPTACWQIHDTAALRRIAFDAELELGETYMDGAWDPGPEGLPALLKVLVGNLPIHGPRGLARLAQGPLSLLHYLNRVGRSRRNVAHHYDIDEWLFRRFLDSDMQYSCAYFETPESDLETAQTAKRRHIAAKLLLEPGQRVLDIGCGWGGLAIELAQAADVQVVGLTLSKEQLRVARQRVQEAGLEGQVEFILQDYREHRGSYDRIVSVGMFEHVGPPNYQRFFGQIQRLLNRNGVALLHTIGHFGSPAPTNPWIRRHIFPGGYLPSLAQLAEAVDEVGLVPTDVEVLRYHYADTLAAWLRRFNDNREEIVERMGERFGRMWEFYLASCEAAFRWSNLLVFQLQLGHHLGAAPMTRDYLYLGLRGQRPGLRLVGAAAEQDDSLLHRH